MPKMSQRMSIWLREEQKAQPPGMTSAGWGGGPLFSDAFRFRRAPSLPALAEAFKSLIYTATKCNADAVARVPLRLFRAGQSKGDTAKFCDTRQATSRERIRLKSLAHTSKAMAGAEEVEEITGEHPLLQLIQNVNPSMDQSALIQYTVMSLDVVGTAFWWPDEFTLGTPREFWALPPHLVNPVMTGYGLVPEKYQFGAIQYRPEDLLIFKHLSMKNPYGLGMSPTQAAIEYARLEDTFVSTQDDLLSNGPRPSVVISHKDPKGAFGSAERQRLESDMNTKGRGGRSGGAFVVDGAVAVTPISWTPADLGSIEISKYDMERILGCFGVPVSFVTNESSNMAVAREGLEQHARQAVEPRCKTIASVLTRWTHALDKNGSRNWSKLFWAFDDCVPGDQAAEAAKHTAYVAMGLPPNVALTEAGYDAVEGGDVSFVASGLTTLENAVKPPEPPVMPGQKPGDDPEAPDDEPTTDEADADEAKTLDAEIADVLASVRTKLAILPDTKMVGGIEYEWDSALKRYVPCRDANGRFASCGGGSGSAKPRDKKPGAGKKPAKKPKEPKPKKPATPREPAKPKEPKKPAAPKPPKEKPAPTPKPAKEPKKPAETKPPKEAKPKEKPVPKPKPEKPKPAAAAETNFGPSKAKVTASPDVSSAEAAAQAAKARRILGPKATDADIASITGAPDNAKVFTADPIFGHPDSMALYVNAPGMQALRRIERHGGELVIRNDSFHVEKTGTGLGAQVFGRQVEQAARLGATKITTLAARGPGMNGYITWPKLGYDAPIPGNVSGKLPASLKSAKNISDLMKTKAGTEWWTKHGETVDMTFDLKPGSPNRAHLTKYLAAKGFGQ